MRARSLKPGFFTNEILGAADPLISILFAGLWGLADREGRLEDRPRRIYAQLFAVRPKVKESHVERWLTWLHEQKFIVRYAIAQNRYIQILEFTKHQSPHFKEPPSKIPALSSISPRAQPEAQPQSVPVHSRADSGLRTPDSGLRTPERDPLPLTPSPQAERGNGGASAPSERRPRSVRKAGRDAWDRVLDAAQHGLSTVGDADIDRAVQQMGGFARIGQSHVAQRQLNRDRFREIYETILDKRAHDAQSH